MNEKSVKPTNYEAIKAHRLVCGSTLRALLRPYSRTIPRVIWWSLGGGAVCYERGTPVCHRAFAYLYRVIKQKEKEERRLQSVERVSRVSKSSGSQPSREIV